MNLVVLSGRLTKDPELKFGQSGKAYTRFSIAVDRAFSKENTADFFTCVAFGKTAEFIGEYFRKGKKIMLQGKIQNNNYEADGKTVYGTNIVVDTVEFADGKASGDGYVPNNNTSAKASNKTDAHVEDANDFETVDDDDFPF